MLSLFNLPIHHLSSLLKNGISLDQVYLLELIQHDVDISSISTEARRVALLQPLVKKGLLTNLYKVTPQGTELYRSLFTPAELVIRTVKTTDEFEKWWSAYPSTDAFTIGILTFPATRSMRKRKDVCALKFRKIIAEGNYTSEEMIKALELEVSQRKQKSLQTRRNELHYMTGTEPYLNQGGYEGFVEEIRKGTVLIEDQRNVIDI